MRGANRNPGGSTRDSRDTGKSQITFLVPFNGGGGSDISPLTADAVPGFGAHIVGIHYFDWHHTDADSFGKIVPREFQLNVASLAVLSYVLADRPERLSDLR